MSCDNCGADPVVMSVMDTTEFDTTALCADCVPGFALSLALGSNAHMVDEDGRHKWVLAIPEHLHETAAEFYRVSVFADPEASTPPAGPTPDASSDGGQQPDAAGEPPPGHGHDGDDLADDGGPATVEMPAAAGDA